MVQVMGIATATMFLLMPRNAHWLPSSYDTAPVHSASTQKRFVPLSRTSRFCMSNDKRSESVSASLHTLSLAMNMYQQLHETASDITAVRNVVDV
eukprot:7970-Heterococcus_DN1.PRE.2